MSKFQDDMLGFIADYVKIEVTSANKEDLYIDFLGSMFPIKNYYRKLGPFTAENPGYAEDTAFIMKGKDKITFLVAVDVKGF